MISEKCQIEHDKAVENGEKTYIDPETGYRVMTSQFLMQRGFCCNNGCRHCPYVNSIDINDESSYNEESNLMNKNKLKVNNE